QELGEIAPDGAFLGSVGRAQVDQQHSDLRSGDRRMINRFHAAAMGSNGSERMRLPDPAWIALATAGASGMQPSPLTPPGASLLGMISTTTSGASPRRGKAIPPSGRARGIPATHSGLATVACAKAQMSPAETCCSTRPLLTTRPQSTAATRRWTLILWSSPMLALATRPMCEPKADAP